MPQKVQKSLSIQKFYARKLPMVLHYCTCNDKKGNENSFKHIIFAAHFRTNGRMFIEDKNIFLKDGAEI